jgi:hypothetical protein
MCNAVRGIVDGLEVPIYLDPDADSLVDTIAVSTPCSQNAGAGRHDLNESLALSGLSGVGQITDQPLVVANLRFGFVAGLSGYSNRATIGGQGAIVRLLMGYSGN